jgi:hypothetical protein
MDSDTTSRTVNLNLQPPAPDQAGSPGYVQALASLLCQRPRVASIAHEIDALPGTLAALVRTYYGP